MSSDPMLATLQAELAGVELGKPESLITYVTDRKGHDQRYAIDPAKIQKYTISKSFWLLPTTI